MERQRVQPEDARRIAVERYGDPTWLARHPVPERLFTDEAIRRRVDSEALAHDLQDLGYPIDSPSEIYLYGYTESVFPLLLAHLPKPYPAETRRAIAHALCVRDARPWWPEIKSAYLVESDPKVKEALASALAAIASRKTTTELMELTRDESNGSSRIMFLRPLKRSKDAAAIALLDSLVDDPKLGVEAKRAIAGVSPNS